jgi:hypothetical protein
MAVAAAAGLGGCQWQVASGPGRLDSSTLSFAGRVAGWPVTGTLEGRLQRVSSEPGCVRFSGTVTLTDDGGDQLVKQQVAQLCLGEDAATGIRGESVVTGGTGRFAGATGAATTTLRLWTDAIGVQRFTLDEFGWLDVPGAARAATARRSRLQGRVTRVRVRGCGRCAVRRF